MLLHWREEDRYLSENNVATLHRSINSTYILDHEMARIVYTK